MKLELPDSKQQGAREKKTVVVNIDQKGNIYLETVLTNLEELSLQLKNLT